MLKWPFLTYYSLKIMGCSIFSCHLITSEYSSLLEKYSGWHRSLTKIKMLTKMLVTVILLLRHATWWGDLILRLIKQSSNRRSLFLTASDPSSSFYTILQNSFYAQLIANVSWNTVLPSPISHANLTPLFSMAQLILTLSRLHKGPHPLHGFPTLLLL